MAKTKYTPPKPTRTYFRKCKSCGDWFLIQNQDSYTCDLCKKNEKKI